MAQFRIDQVTPGAGTAGRARTDLIAGEIITLVATQPTGPGVTYTWEILDRVGSAAVLSATTGATVTIGDASAIVAPCTFVIKMTASDGTSSIRIASVRAPRSGLRYRGFGETSPPSARINANTPDLSTDNSVYANLAGTGSSGQNWRGWAESDREIVNAIETLAASGGGGDIYVFQPGGTAGGKTYTSWSALYTAANAAAGPKLVFIDTTFSAATIPAGSYTITGWTLFALPKSTRTALSLAEGVTLTGSWAAHNLALSTAATTGNPVVVTSGTTLIRLYNSSLNGSTRAFTKVAGFGNPTVTIELKDESSLLALSGAATQQGIIKIILHNNSGTISSTAFSNTGGELLGGGELQWIYVGTALNGGTGAIPAQSSWSGGTLTYTRRNDLRYATVIPINLPLNAQQTGTTELHVGSVYLLAGTTVLGTSEALLGGSAGGQTANLRMRAQTGNTITGGDYTTIGTLAGAQPLGGEFTISASDWYNFYLYAGNVAHTAIVKGLRLLIRPSLDNGL